MNSASSRMRRSRWARQARRASTLLLGIVAVTAGCRPAPRAPDVFLVLIDTLRADRLGVYGAGPGNSPRIDELAATATVFQSAICQAPHTIPSVLQIMTSRYSPDLEIPPERPTIAQLLHDRGYQTVAVVDNPNFEVHPQAHGLRRAFDRFDRNGLLDRRNMGQQLYKTNTSADAVTTQAVRRIRARDRGRPIFLWVHYSDPHDPYMPPFSDDLERLTRENPSSYTGDIRATPLFHAGQGMPDPVPADADRRHLLDLYDAEVRHVDQAVGDLMDHLRMEGLFDDALVILTSDHGESFGEHGFWMHGRSGFDPEIHVPLVVKLPNQRATRLVPFAVETLDILPTVLYVTGVPSRGLGLNGRSLLESRTGADTAFLFWREWQVARTMEWKLVKRGETVQLFDIRRDPGETDDVAAHRRDVARGLLESLKTRLKAVGSSASHLQRRSEETLESLHALGYAGP